MENFYSTDAGDVMGRAHCVRTQPLSEAPLFKSPAQASKGMVCTNPPIASAAGVEMFAVVSRRHVLCTKRLVVLKRLARALVRAETLLMPRSPPSSACPWLSL